MSPRADPPTALRRGPALLVHVPLEPKGPNGADGALRAGWRARHAQAKRIGEHLALALAQTSAAPTLERARVEYLRTYRAAPLDPDNLVASAKPVLDALQRAGVIRSDDRDHLVLSCRQKPRAGRGPHFQLRIEPCATCSAPSP